MLPGLETKVVALAHVAHGMDSEAGAGRCVAGLLRGYHP
jgi:hypothetical protein